MGLPEHVACRVAGHRLRASRWDFYLINDGDQPLTDVRLDSVIYTWGSAGSSESGRFACAELQPGAIEKIWSEGSDGLELEMDFLVLATVAGQAVQLRFEFPKLYRMRNVPEVPGLDKPGYGVEPSVSKP